MSQKQIKYALDSGSVLSLEGYKLFSDLVEYAKELQFENAQLKREKAEKDECIKACEKRENDLIDRMRPGL